MKQFFLKKILIKKKIHLRKYFLILVFCFVFHFIILNFEKNIKKNKKNICFKEKGFVKNV